LSPPKLENGGNGKQAWARMKILPSLLCLTKQSVFFSQTIKYH
jgi:hypothetical protein